MWATQIEFGVSFLPQAWLGHLGSKLNDIPDEAPVFQMCLLLSSRFGSNRHVYSPTPFLIKLLTFQEYQVM